jgi:hypothetical protein
MIKVSVRTIILASVFGMKIQLCVNLEVNVSIQDPNCRYGSSTSGGIEYVIPRDSCQCFWDSSANSGAGACGLNYSVVPGVGNDPFNFATCQFVFSSGECVDGFEDYSYTATFDNRTLDDLLPGDARCLDRSGRRRCGEPIVKVPFFDGTNIIAIIILIVLFYVLAKKFGTKKPSKKSKLTKKKKRSRKKK